MNEKEIEKESNLETEKCQINFWGGVVGRFGPHLEVSRAYSWLCAQGTDLFGTYAQGTLYGVRD